MAAQEAESSATVFFYAHVSVFKPPAEAWCPSKPIGTTTYIDHWNRGKGVSWSKSAHEDCFELVGYEQCESDASENLKKSWMHFAVTTAFRFALSGRVVRFVGDEMKIALKDHRVSVSDYKEPSPCRRISGELDLVFYDVEKQRYFLVDVKTVHSLRCKNLSEAALKMRAAQQLRTYALLLRWSKNLDYMPEAYVLGIHVNDRGKTGYWKLNQEYLRWSTIEEAIKIF